MQAPKLPEDYKLAIIGPAKSGKQTQAKLLM